jgi:hypothetical protein
VNGCRGKKGGLLLLSLGVRGLDWRLYRGGWRRISSPRLIVCPFSISFSSLSSHCPIFNVKLIEGEARRRERLMTDHHPREIREAFLSSLTTSTKQKSKPGRYNDPSKATSLALARAATALPGDYAVMSNIVREMNGRLGRDWVGEGVVEISSSHGPGIWYVLFFSSSSFYFHCFSDLKAGEGVDRL